MAGWLAGWDGSPDGWLEGWLCTWLAGGLPAGGLGCQTAGWKAGWRDGWLEGLLADWMAGSLLHFLSVWGLALGSWILFRFPEDWLRLMGWPTLPTQITGYLIGSRWYGKGAKTVMIVLPADTGGIPKLWM